jgi:hypothetical protein
MPFSPNGLRYLRVGRRGLCLGAGKPEARKLLENAAESPPSTARFVRPPFALKATHANTV